MHRAESSITRCRDGSAGSLVLVATGASDHLDPTRTYCGRAQSRCSSLYEPCPWCKSKDDLATLNYAYGDELGCTQDASARRPNWHEWPTNTDDSGFYLVEVQILRLNHLPAATSPGDGVPRPALRATRDMLD